MKIKKANYLKWVPIFASVLIVVLCTAASKSDKQVNIHVNQNQYSELNLKGVSDNFTSFKAVDMETGAFGYKLDGEVIWLKGKPVSKKLKDGYSYTWQNNSTNIEMSISYMVNEYTIEINFKDPQGRKVQEWYVNVSAGEKEYFTGIFERVIDGKQNNSWKDNITTAMNLRGEIVEMKLKPTVSAYAPFYISSANYGMFVNGTWPGAYDFCKTSENSVKISFEGPSLQFKIYHGNPAEIVQKHTMETGPPFIPPRWSFGPWRWRDNHHNDSIYFDGTVKKSPYCTDVVEDVLMMKAYDIPHTAVWIDRPWGPGNRGFDDYEFDTKRIPDPEGMIKWLNSHEIELMMWIGPFVMGDMADYAEEHKYHLISKEWMNSRQVLIDFTNEEAVKWWGENGPGKLAKMGIKGFKLDRADGEKLTDSIHHYTSIGTTYRENYNDYPRQYVKAAYEAVQPILQDDFVLFPRAQYTGSALYGGMWAGDTNGKQEGLRSAIIAMLRCAIMGYPIWGSDVGGYWGKFDHEVTMRWLAFGCFSPLMEVGPTNDKGFWNNPTEPAYDVDLIAAWRLYSKIRMELIDYIMGYAVESRMTGMPVARPLFLVYPDQQQAWDDWQTYLLGDDILVSAIWEKGVSKHSLYLPNGETWVDAWDLTKEYEGGQYVHVDAPPHKIPLFFRKDAGIDLGNLNALWEESLKIASKKPDLKKLEAEEGWK